MPVIRLLSALVPCLVLGTAVAQDAAEDDFDVTEFGFNPPTAPPTDGAEWIGNPLAAPMNIANGRMQAEATSFRFNATDSGCVDDLTMWWRYNDVTSPDANYSKGDGGEYLIQLRPDDGTGVPADEVLDETTFVPDVEAHPNSDPGNAFRAIEFAGEACLERDEVYHLVFGNRSKDPVENYVSFNGPYLRDVGQNTGEAIPCPECTGTVALRQEVNGQWILFPNAFDPAMVYLPYWCATLDSGASVGQTIQYGHEVVEPVPTISGRFRVRQTFTLDEDLDGPVRLRFYAKRVDGDAPLSVLMNDETVARVEMPDARSADVQDGRVYDWYTVEHDADVVAGPLMVEFRTDEGSAYEVASSVQSIDRCGAPAYGFSGGRAEVSTDAGQTWTGPTVFDKPDKTNVQLSLYLARED